MNLKRKSLTTFNKRSLDPAGNLFSVDGKTVVITGGLGKLGGEFGRMLLRCGAKVVALDCGMPPAGERGRFDFIRADVTSQNSLQKAFRRIKKRWGIPDGLVNCAVIDAPPNASALANGPLELYAESEWDRVMAVNAKGVFLACQVFGSVMAHAGRGSIVNVNSIYGMLSPDQRLYAYRKKNGRGFFKPISYSASKSAVFNLTRYLATYWAERNVRVNSLTLGGVFDGQDPRFLKGYRQRVPMGRMARPDEYNGAVLFLLSQASSYMTGANLVIDGGWTAW